MLTAPLPSLPPDSPPNTEIVEHPRARRHTRAVSCPRQGDTAGLSASQWLSGKELFLLKTLYRRLRRVEKYPPKEAQVDAIQNRPPLTLHAEADIPQIFEGLFSEDDGVFDKATKIIASIANYQLRLFHDEIVPLIPSILTLISISPNDARRSALIDLFRNIGLASPASLTVLRKHADPDTLIEMLLSCAPMARKSMVRLLDGMLGRSNAENVARLQNRLTKRFRVRFSMPLCSGESSESTSWDASSIQDTMGVVDVLASALCRRRNRFGLALLKAGALEFLLQIATTPAPLAPTTFFYVCANKTAIADLRIAAISCLDGVLSAVNKNLIKSTDLPHLSFQKPERRLGLQGHILTPIISLIDDADLTVSDHVVELLNTGYLSASNPVEIFLWTEEGSLERLVRKLALGGGKKSGRGRGPPMNADQNTPGKWAILEEAITPMIDAYSQTAWLLQDIFTRLPQGVVRAFETFWAREDVEDQLRQNLVQVLAEEVPAEVRHAALCASLPVPENIQTEVGPEKQEREEKAQALQTAEVAKIQAMVVDLFMTDL